MILRDDLGALKSGVGALHDAETLLPDKDVEYGWFGHSATAYEVNGLNFVAVGEPNYRCDDCEDSVGKVTIFRDGAPVDELVGRHVEGLVEGLVGVTRLSDSESFHESFNVSFQADARAIRLLRRFWRHRRRRPANSRAGRGCSK